MTIRRWIAEQWDDATATISGAQAEHMARVLRATPGMEADVVAGGHVFHAEVAAVAADEIRFNLIAEVRADPALPVTLVVSVYKFDRMEWAIEKATELGVAAIAPVIARRTEKHLAQAAAKRVERWRRIVREAAQQSRRTDVPVVDEPTALKLALGMVSAEKKLLLAETEQENSLRAALESNAPSVALAIGPEGGWTAEEMGLFSEQGWHHVTLGPRILRAETAAIAGLAICSAMLG